MHTCSTPRTVTRMSISVAEPARSICSLVMKYPIRDRRRRSKSANRFPIELGFPSTTRPGSSYAGSRSKTCSTVLPSRNVIRHTPGEYPGAATSSVYWAGGSASSKRPTVSTVTVSRLSTTTRAPCTVSRVTRATTCPWSTPGRLWAGATVGVAKPRARSSQGAGRGVPGRRLVCTGVSWPYCIALKRAGKEARGVPGSNAGSCASARRRSVYPRRPSLGVAGGRSSLPVPSHRSRKRGMSGRSQHEGAFSPSHFFFGGQHEARHVAHIRSPRCHRGAARGRSGMVARAGSRGHRQGHGPPGRSARRRSRRHRRAEHRRRDDQDGVIHPDRAARAHQGANRDLARALYRLLAGDASGHAHVGRSEEHTSELQSLAYLVCRLLLEKKKLRKHSVLQCSQLRIHSST